MKDSGRRVVVEELQLDENLFGNYEDAPLFLDGVTLNPCVKKLSLKPEGKKAMDRESFVNGYLK